MKGYHVGELEVVTFRSTRDDANYKVELKGIATGTSTGHVALRLHFKSKELFDRYIRNNRSIPHKIMANHLNGEEAYEVYISFWPDGEWGFTGTAGVFRPYLYDCEQSANYTPMEYTDEAAEYLHPLRKDVAPRLPIGRSIFQQQITLPPSIILHTSRLGMAFGTKQPNGKMPIANEAVMKCAQEYTKSYRQWRGWVIMNQNLTLSQGKENMFTKLTERFMLAMRARNFIDEVNLRKVMYPRIQMSHDEFMTKLEPFVSFGFPEQDVAKIPLISLRSPCKVDSTAEMVYGLELEPMLRHIKYIADNPKLNAYNVVSYNCATVAERTLEHGNVRGLHRGLTQHFEQQADKKIFNISTPTLLIKSALKAKQILTRLPSSASLSELDDNDSDDDLPTTRMAILATATNRSLKMLR